MPGVVAAKPEKVCAQAAVRLGSSLEAGYAPHRFANSESISDAARVQTRGSFSTS